ncbi:MAG: hypothetical protein V1743_04180 [Nanoarchaeota archaeon]
MRFSKTALEVLQQVAKGNTDIIQIAASLKKSKSQLYRICQQLDILTVKRSIVHPVDQTHVALLLQLLARHPSIIRPLSGCGIAVFSAIREPKSIKEIARTAGVTQSMAYHKLQIGKNMSLITMRNKNYVLNGRIWPKAKEFLEELKLHQEAADPRAPSGAVIYFKNEKEIVFSFEGECDATPTAFSAFKLFGILLRTPFQYYYLPKRALSKQEVFRHALHVTEKELRVSNIIYIALFSIKHHLKGFQSSILENISRIMNGERITGYPTLEEIKEKAELYDIRL